MTKATWHGLALGILAGLFLGPAVAQLMADSINPFTAMGEEKMQRVTGIGGVFFKSEDPETTRAWYRDRLGIEAQDVGGQEIVLFQWRELANPEYVANTVWAPFDQKTEYFDVKAKPGAEFMINYRVDDMTALLADLRTADVTVLGETSEFNGKFAWIEDPDGRRVELWEPAPGF